MRIHVVTPKAPVNVTLNPRVQPAPTPCPIFVTGIQEPVRLSQSSYWILRLPYPSFIHVWLINASEFLNLFQKSFTSDYVFVNPYFRYALP